MIFLIAVSSIPRPHGQNVRGTMLTVINSFLLVFVSEMGDKTQLLALILAAKFRKPWTVMLGIFVATLLNHALAAYAGAWVSNLFSEKALLLILAASFFGFGLWILVPDKDGDVSELGHFGAFATTVISFFIAEMGDKTQLATIALGAKYTNTWLVTLGTTLGMMASNAIAIFFGEKFLCKIPMPWVRRFACGLFILFSLLVLLQFFRLG